MNKNFKYNFVIITPGRSGSEHLSETLNNCEDIEMEGEVFNRANRAIDSFNTYLNLQWWLRLLSFFFNREKLSQFSLNLPLRYLIFSFLSIKQPSKTIKGFKLTFDQLNAYPLLLNLLIRNNCKIIYLYRKDCLAQVLSLLKARQTGTYHNRAENKEDSIYTFDKEQVKNQYLGITQWEESLTRKLEGLQYFSLSYEQLFNNYKLSIDHIRKYLNLPKSGNYQYSDLIKTNQKTLDKWVANLDEIKKHLET